jgi:tetratricopeptide (TPR) repeat protein
MTEQHSQHRGTGISLAQSGFESPQDFIDDLQQRLGSENGRVSIDDHTLLKRISEVSAALGDNEQHLIAAELRCKIGEDVLPPRDMRHIDDRRDLASAQFANGKHFLAISTLSETAQEAIDQSIGSNELKMQLCLQVSRYCVTAREFEEALRWAEAAEQTCGQNPDVNIAQHMEAKLQCSQTHKYLGNHRESAQSFIETYDMLRAFGEIDSTSSQIKSQVRNVLDVMQKMVESCEQSQQFYEAELLSREMCRLIALAPDKTDALEAAVQEKYAEALLNNGKFDDARKLFEQCQQALPSDPSDRGRYYAEIRIAALAGEQGNPLEEERVLTRLSHALASSATPLPMQRLTVNNQLAHAQLSQGRASASLTTIKGSWEILSELGSPEFTAALGATVDEMPHTIRETLLNTAPQNRRLTQHLFSIASDCFLAEGAATQQLRLIQSLGKKNQSSGEYETKDEPVDALRKSHLIKELLQHISSASSRSSSAYSLSQILNASGHEEAGEELIQEALELARPEEPEALPGLTYMQVTIGNARRARLAGDYSESEELLEEAAAILERFPRHSGGTLKASLLLESGKLHLTLGQKGDAIECFEQAEEILNVRGQSSTPSMLSLQLALQGAYQETGQVEDAMRSESRINGIIAALQFENQGDEEIS